MKPLLCCFALALSLFPLIGVPVSGLPPFEAKAGDLEVGGPVVCTTTGQFDGKTRVTFYGDSRMGFVDWPLYGGASMDFYVGADSTWNVQNCGHEGWDSTQLRNHLRKCLHASGNSQPDYWISDQIVFHQGGNDHTQDWRTSSMMTICASCGLSGMC